MNLGIETATEDVLAGVLSERLRRSYLLTLPAGINLPVTSGLDEVLPFWDLNTGDPSSAARLMQANPRPPPPNDTASAFIPSMIRGGPGVTGTGWMEVEVMVNETGNTITPGLIPEMEHLVTVRHRLYLPAPVAHKLRGPYLSAINALWRQVYLGRDKFDPFFDDPLVGVFEIRQDGLEKGGKRMGREGQDELVMLDVVLKRRSANAPAN